MKVRSLARQTVVIVVLTQLLSTVTLAAAALINERNTRFHTFDVQLEGRSDSLLGAIQDAEDPGDNVAVDPAELSIPRGDVYAVYSRDGRLLGRSPGAPRELLQPGRDGYRSARVHGVSYRLYQRGALRVIDRAETRGIGLKRPVTILYASPDGHVRHEVLEAVRFYLIAVVLAGAITAAVVTTLLRRSLQPLTVLAETASRLSAKSLRFEPPQTVEQVQELRPLVQALTTTVAGLRHAFETEQRFFGDAAHELKTAIAVVRSSVQVLMLRDRSAGEYRAGLERVLDDNTRVERLVAQMLRLATVAETPSREIGVGCDLAQIADEVCDQLAPIASMREVRVERQLAANRVRLSPDDARTLVSNLLLNALQHSKPQSYVVISVTAPERTVCLRVEDHGEGIGAQALPHIFDRFYREDASRSRNTGGTGLGLSICKAIADAAQGKIDIASESGRGTTVLVTFTGN